MGVSINQINSGLGLLIEGEIFLVLTSKHVKPGKGGAFVKVKLKNIKTSQIQERTLRSSDKFEDISLDERKLQYLYNSGDAYHFMDNTSYEEVVIAKDALGDSITFLQDQLEVEGQFYENRLLKVKLPTFITAEIMHTEIGLKGDSSKAGTKPATIDTGATIQVPLFVNMNDWVRIDTRSGQYVERVQK